MTSVFPTATIDLGALRNNLAVVRRLAPDSQVIAAVKADAYGHGLVPVARALAAADALGVARLEEAAKLRAAGIANRIVLLEGAFCPQQLAAAAQLDLEIVVHTFEQLASLEQQAHRFNVWLKIDTGMNRLGFALADAAEALARLRCCPAVATLRLMTHLASAEEQDNPQTPRQLERFAELAQPLGLERCIANSAGLISWPQARLEWVRPGLMLYGVSPLASRSTASLGLRPVMTLSTRLIALRQVAPGETIGYNGIWRAQRPSTIGVAAIGYADGYPRAMRGGAPVLVGGSRASIAGRVSMDMTMIDVTDVPAARVGDPVTLWGAGLPIEEVAPWADTISYELLCRVGQRVTMFWSDTAPER